MDARSLLLFVGWGVALVAGVVVEQERGGGPQAVIKADRHTAVIPAHSFAPKFVFVGEQWLPAPTESHANKVHRVCLVEKAKLGRRDSRKAESQGLGVYVQAAAHAEQFGKVLLSSAGCTDTAAEGADAAAGCTDTPHHRLRMQARALGELLPALCLRTSATEVQHLRYSLVDYSLQTLENIDTARLRQTLGDLCSQPLYLLLRVYECSKLPDFSPPDTPTHAGGPPGALEPL
ncbi:hypothetical protein ETH_00038005 [Eimeria tenella]|uniref:Uncharacterized protein n=1 Tax=Eimeria tenella TaxID=5802 RepID=U6KTH9_EIMTE|nr:hypothetical protein ETH_00038005 [Eimeria tenella]CDJ38810.1 hypothetical protein ETH_00038005 [Eimeria tenella]|eukprot:XP_013229566.1 hypothetical protein ETH_00038005 [Eimeria tenella]